MPELAIAQLENIIIHYVGNPVKEQELKLANDYLKLDGQIKELLGHYFLNPFKSEALYHFMHPDGYENNEMFQIATGIFDEPGILPERSQDIARRLFELSSHPQIKGGELFVAYIKNCVVDNEETDAIGIFKSENKDTFLKVYEVDEEFNIDHSKGININKLDKGCLIFNLQKENGYLVSVVDSKKETGNEALYWMDEFLDLKPRNDEFNNTSGFLNMFKGFCNDTALVDEEIDKTEQAGLINKAKDYFTENKNFNTKKFEEEVIESPNLINTFREYKDDFQTSKGLEVVDEFDISQQAFNENKKFMKSVLKLDKNFHVYIHGDHKKIERGFDQQNGMKFYKLYYENES